MFHLAYLLGSQITLRKVLTKEELASQHQLNRDALDVLFQINMAHVIVPLFNLLIMISETYK